MEKIDYSQGYRKALMDLHVALSKWEPSFRADRKRNNVKNVVRLLDCILDDPDTFAAFVDLTPIYFRPKPNSKDLEYYIKNKWPLCHTMRKNDVTRKEGHELTLNQLLNLEARGATIVESEFPEINYIFRDGQMLIDAGKNGRLWVNLEIAVPLAKEFLDVAEEYV